MALINTINRSTPNDGLGDPLYDQAGIINDNFSELNNKKVEVVAGKDLSENDFTDADKAKLDGIEEGAQVNVIPNWAQEDPGEPDYILNKPEGSTAIEIMDGFAGVTAGFAVGQLTYTIPEGKKVIDVYVAHAKQYKATGNNTSLNRWSQSGTTLTITKSPSLNNYIYFEIQ